MREKIIFGVLIVFCSLVAVGCSHRMEVKNLSKFSAPISLDDPDKKINLGVKSFNGDSETIWYYNSIIQKLYSRREFGKFKSNYIDGRCDFKPDYIISIDLDVKYESSPLNFPELI